MKNYQLNIILSILAVGLFSCSSEKEVVVDPNAPAREITINGTDQMQFDVGIITAKPGEKLKIVMSNVGKMPAQSMSHNWVLLKPMLSEDIAELANEAVQHGPEYLPADMSSVIVHTKMCGPGESDTVEFNAPTKKGHYPYICSFPGHYMTMKGEMVVQ